MKKKFFTKASPKAAEGIRRAYAETGATVKAVMDPKTGLVTVVVTFPNEEKTSSKRLVAA